MSLHQSGVDDGLFRRAMAWLDAPWVRQLETAMTAKTGRPRVHSVSAILGLLAIAALETPGELFLSRAAAVTKRLSLAQMHRLDLVAPGIVTKRQVSRVLADVELAIAGRIDRATGEVLVTPRLDIDFADLLTAIVSSVIPASIPGSVAQSLDSTDLEAHAKRQSRAKHADVPKDSLPPGDYLASESTSIRAGFPKRGPTVAGSTRSTPTQGRGTGQARILGERPRSSDGTCTCALTLPLRAETIDRLSSVACRSLQRAIAKVLPELQRSTLSPAAGSRSNRYSPTGGIPICWPKSGPTS